MIIALDYDDTFTRDPILWTGFVGSVIQRGHSVTFVTSRYDRWDNTDIEDDAKLLGIDIVYCGMKPKSSIFHADVWIDDNPSTIPVYTQKQYADLHGV